MNKWNNKFRYQVASCWLFLLSHTTMHGSINMKFKHKCAPSLNQAPRHADGWGVEVQLHAFLTLALGSGKYPLQTQEKIPLPPSYQFESLDATPKPICIMCKKEKYILLSGFEPLLLQFYHCIKWTVSIPVTLIHRTTHLPTDLPVAFA